MQAGCADSGMNLDTQDALCWWMETTSMDRTQNTKQYRLESGQRKAHKEPHPTQIMALVRRAFPFARVPVDLDQEVGDSKKSVPPSGRLRRKLAWNFIVVTIFARLLSGSSTD